MESDRLIQVMPETLANKIAAGEVVQRPASALKELLENAIDAGATRVDVLVKEAGSTLIQVIDNGSGMSRADAEHCFERHATSKIRTVEDLESIATLGFRGEALASIAAVSQVELRTKRMQDANGWCLRLAGGKRSGVAPCATNNGTSVAVKNLFFNVPARRNFLKKPATEARHLLETFQFIALSHPELGFSFTQDDHVIHRLEAGGGEARPRMLLQRIGALFGSETASMMTFLEEKTSYLSIEGFIGDPSKARKYRGDQYLFVNDRFVINRYLDHAVQSAYGTLLPEETYPFFVLFMRLHPRHVDVNVHPTKAEIKFDDDRGVYSFLKAVTQKALGSAFLVPELSEQTVAVNLGGELSGDPWARQTVERGDRGAPFPEQGDAGLHVLPREAPGALSDRLYRTSELSTEDREVVPSGRHRAARREDENLLWQLHETYILTQIRSGLMIVDQNVAHERILFEMALQSLKTGSGLSQQLLFPQALDFNAADFELLKSLHNDLRALGFDIELLSGRSVMIRGVPAEVGAGNEQRVLSEILETFRDLSVRATSKTHETLARSMARRGAIKRGKHLSDKEMRALIDQLFQCEMPYAGPDGRPTFIKIPTEELDKRFGR